MQALRLRADPGHRPSAAKGYGDQLDAKAGHRDSLGAFDCACHIHIQKVCWWITRVPWPLKKSTPERIRALTPAQLRRADDAIDVILKGFEAEGK